MSAGRKNGCHQSAGEAKNENPKKSLSLTWWAGMVVYLGSLPLLQSPSSTSPGRTSATGLKQSSSSWLVGLLTENMNVQEVCLKYGNHANGYTFLFMVPVSSPAPHKEQT